MTTNDTRTAQERAEELAADEWRRDEALAAEAERQTPFNGWENAMENAALQQKFIDGANWQAARDAEPTTVTAEQVTAEIHKVTSNWDEPLDEVHDIPQITNALLAQFRIEGDPA